MKFFHVYNDWHIKGLEKNGFINRDTGFKVQNVFSVPHERQFNNIARIGGELHSLIKENKYPFYCDRLAGGIAYYKYEYDKALIKEYSEILGDWFLGFQLHECASNRRQADWPTLIRRTGSKGPYDVKVLDEVMKKPNSVTPYGEILWALSQGSVEEYSHLTFKETPEEYYEEIKELFSARMKETEGRILPVDSYFLMTKLQDELGMKTFMPEVGSQIADMRIEVALARGIARASGKTWGTYYECWHNSFNAEGKIICTMPCFNNDPVNEWYLAQENHGDDFSSFGENGGSSRLLQNRIYYYSLMSGADYLAEEWGLNCSYYDMQEFTLSPYGKTKLDFINEAVKLRGMRAEAPFALVLPKEYSTVEVRGAIIFPNAPFTYMNYELEGAKKEYIKHVRDVIDLVFEKTGEKFGNEGHVIKNSRFGDLFDIIFEDTNEDAMKKYACLIDASPDGDFAKKSGDKFRVLESSDLGRLEAEIKTLIPEVMPVTVSDLCWLVSKDENGRRFLSIFNNDGNMRTIEKGDVIDKDADRTVEVKFKEAADIKVIREGNFPCEITKVDELTYKVKVPATAFVIFEF